MGSLVAEIRKMSSTYTARRHDLEYRNDARSLARRKLQLTVSKPGIDGNTSKQTFRLRKIS